MRRGSSVRVCFCFSLAHSLTCTFARPFINLYIESTAAASAASEVACMLKRGNNASIATAGDQAKFNVAANPET